MALQAVETVAFESFCISSSTKKCFETGCHSESWLSESCSSEMEKIVALRVVQVDALKCTKGWVTLPVTTVAKA